VTTCDSILLLMSLDDSMSLLFLSSINLQCRSRVLAGYDTRHDGAFLRSEVWLLGSDTCSASTILSKVIDSIRLTRVIDLVGNKSFVNRHLKEINFKLDDSNG
jgi:hypothetical protein